MGYIERAAGIPNFSSGVMELWFNVPQASIDVKSAEFTAWLETEGFDGDLIGVIPLETFGPNTETAFFPGDSVTGNLSPCVVGVLCDNAPSPHLYARFQYDYGAPGYTATIDFNDFFQVGGSVGTGVSGGSGAQYISVTADVWHHVLISFDFSGGCATTFDETNAVNFVDICPFHWAFDNVNYTGNYLNPGTPSVYGQAAAAGIVSEWSRALAAAEPPSVLPSSYSFAAGDLTTSGNPFGVPASSDRAAHIQRVRKSRFRLFTGVTCDFSVEANRRAFITADNLQASISAAPALLGKQPEIHFETHDDFITGNNQGTAGDFSPTGTISPYTPGPG